MVCAGMSVNGHTDLHVCHGEALTAVRYWDEMLSPCVTSCASAIDEKSILMVVKTQPH